MPVAETVTAKSDSKWFDASLLKGKPRQVIIADVNEREFKNFQTGAPEKKFVLTLETATGAPIQQGLILNPTRKKAMIRFHGNKPNGWIGKELILSPEQTSFGGMTVDIAMPVQPDQTDEQPGLDDADTDNEFDF